MNRSLKISIAIAAAIVLIGAAVGAVIAVSGSKKPHFTYLTVGRGDLQHEVRLIGSVHPVESVDLAFERGGRLVRVIAAVGDKVSRGQAIAFLDGSDLAAQEAQAQAALEGAQARLADLKRGLRPEEADLQDVKVAGAEDALSQARAAAVNTLASVYALADDAVRGKTDQFFSASTSPSPRLTFFVADDALKTRLELNRVLIEGTLNRWQAETSRLTSDADLVAAAVAARQHLTDVKDFLADAALAVDKIDLRSNSGLTDTAVAGYKANLSLARTNVASAVSATSGIEQQLAAAVTALRLSQSERTLKAMGATPEAVASQEAAVHQAEAALEAVRVQVAKTVLRSPLGGVVTRQDGHVGQIVAPNLPLVSIISDQSFEIKAAASETDVANIHVGDAAAVTLDAYGSGTVFDAEVVAVDPAETGVAAAPSYQVTLHFKAADGRIKSGLTANVTVVAGVRAGVIAIPRQAVILRGDKSFVMAETPTGPQEKEVTLGLLGSDGRVEITAGLAENDRIADFGGRQ